MALSREVAKVRVRCGRDREEEKEGGGR